MFLFQRIEEFMMLHNDARRVVSEFVLHELTIEKAYLIVKYHIRYAFFIKFHYLWLICVLASFFILLKINRGLYALFSSQ